MSEPAAESSPLAALFSDPARLQALTGLLGSAADTREPHGQNASAPSADGLSRLLSNPELLARLPAVMEMLRPMLGGAGTVQTEKETAPKEETVGEEPSVPTGLSARPTNEERGEERCRRELLLALKPFLSRGRCEAVDMILRLSTLGAVLRHLN